MRQNSTKKCLDSTYSCSQLIFKPLQVKVQIRFGHLILTPACNLSNNFRGHMYNETIRTIKEREEWAPNGFFALSSVVQENFNASVIFLKNKNL